MNKNVVKEGTKPLKTKKNPSPMEYSEPFVPVVRKELSSFGKLCILGLWGVLAFVAGIKMTSDNYISTAQLSQLESKLDALKNRDKGNLLQMNAELEARVGFVKDNLEKEYEDKLHRLGLQQSKLQRQKDEMIEHLKNELAYKNMKAQSSRGPASVVPYNYKNADILRFKHNQKLKRLKEMQKKREASFLAGADLTKPDSQNAFLTLQEEHQLELYSLKRAQREERNNFRKAKFIIKN